MNFFFQVRLQKTLIELRSDRTWNLAKQFLNVGRRRMIHAKEFLIVVLQKILQIFIILWPNFLIIIEPLNLVSPPTLWYFMMKVIVFLSPSFTWHANEGTNRPHVYNVNYPQNSPVYHTPRNSPAKFLFVERSSKPSPLSPQSAFPACHIFLAPNL